MEVRLLGPLEVAGNGSLATLGGKKQSAVLALFALAEGRPVSSDSLVEALWGERPPKTAANTVQVYVSALRKALKSVANDSETIVRDPVGYRLVCPPSSFDHVRFSELAKEGTALIRHDPVRARAILSDALALWRGPALADFVYESWAQPEAARLEELRLSCLEARVDADLDCGLASELVGELEALVAEYPLREHFRGQLMLALYRSGRQAEALDAYQQARATLLEELGIDPGPELQELNRAVLNQAAELAAPERMDDRHGLVQLPVAMTSFVGREHELVEIARRLESPSTRLVTLTGPGGIGKTRLAVAAARGAAERFRDGVVWVSLASLRDSTLVAETIAQVLGAKDSVAVHVGKREMLLVLDNLEQVIEAAPELSKLQEACPNLTLLVTSRELLRVSGEVEYTVPPLAEPEAVSLFCERSQLTPSDEISELCAHLDSLPLGVELAAARTKALSPAQILERLAGRLDLLKGGRDADPRQLTLRATIEWSYELLSPQEQQLFARLSVFAGGCTLEAAEEVCDADLDTMQSLVEKSLLRFTNERYWMLVTIRAFAAERLKELGEAEVLRRRHAHHFLLLAEEAEPKLREREAAAWLRRLDAEHGNMREALSWAASSTSEWLDLRLAGALARFWSDRSYLAEARRWLTAVLARPGKQPPSARARALRGLGYIAYASGQRNEAVQYVREALELYRSIGDSFGTALSLTNLGISLREEGDSERARPLLEEGARLHRELGELSHLAHSLGHLGLVASDEGDLARAVELFEEGVALARKLGNKQITAFVLEDYGFINLRGGRFREAEACFAESLEIVNRLDMKGSAVSCLRGIAAVAAAEGHRDRAARLLGAAESLHEAVHTDVEAALTSDDMRVLTVARSHLGDERSLDAWAEGRAMDADAAIRLGLSAIA